MEEFHKTLLKRKLFLEKKNLRRQSNFWSATEESGLKSKYRGELERGLGALEEINKLLYQFFPKEKK